MCIFDLLQANEVLYNINLRLCIRFNLSPKDQSYVAILIHMMKTDHDNTLEWPFSGRITVNVVHPLYVFPLF